MTYAALDYFLAGRATPNQDYRPANRTPLQSYLYDRQVTSITSNLDKWADLFFNPFGWRDDDLFEAGLDGKKRLKELRACIDRGTPVPLGMKGHKSGDHQVLAIGYDMGRYKGDLKANRADLRIFVYDPNHPGKTMTLVPDVKGEFYTYLEKRSSSWRAYYADTRFARKAPPQIANPNYPKDGKARELVLAFATGKDDLRGGKDNVNLTVHLADGTKQHYANINLGARWLNNYTEHARVVLSKAVLPGQIKSLVLTATSRGGDNWDLSRVSVRALGGNLSKEIASAGPHRFTAARKTLTVKVAR
jgi:hypothetical protein